MNSLKLALRVRPINDLSCIKINGKSVELMVRISDGVKFSFNYIFDQDTNQNTLYNQTVKQLLSNFNEGFNASLITYGSTDSGKTFTTGCKNFSEFPDELDGIIPRILRDLNMLYAGDTNFNLSISLLEIRHKKLKDLL